MVQQGKGHMLDFQDDQVKKLKECFNSLDDDASGSIGIDEIKRPLIGLGLVESVEQVQHLVSLVDEDKSGEIDFEEFLAILMNKAGDVKTRVITDFFKNLTNGKYDTRGLAFANWVLKEQRSHLKNAIKEKEGDGHNKGRRILQAIRTMKEEEKLYDGIVSDASSDF